VKRKREAPIISTPKADLDDEHSDPRNKSDEAPFQLDRERN